jgi:hypothetical protein
LYNSCLPSEFGEKIIFQI